jgi:hypothetical protein
MATFLGFEAQPAYPMYPVDRGWRVARYVAQATFARTRTAAAWWFDHAADFKSNADAADNAVFTYWWYCVAGGCYLAGGAQYVSAMLFVTVFLLLHVLVLSVWFLGAALLIALLAVYTRAYSLYHRAYYRCPACHRAMDLPVFLCSCGTEHTRLWPSLYGVLRHTCQPCGRDLPTTERGGRKAIDRSCPHCHTPLNAAIGAQTNIHIPVVGGPQSGKSNFIVMATHELATACAATGVATVSFPDPVHEREFQANLGRLLGGRELAKTTAVVPQAYNLSIHRAGRGVGKIVYIYDAAGEAYAAEAASQEQIYFQYAHGVVFIVDPFSIPEYREELGTRVDAVRSSLRPSSAGVMETYERMVTVLESNVGLVRGKRFPHPLAVVVTKADAFDLDDRIGPAAAALRLAREPQLGSEAAAADRLTREFLESHGLENFVRDVDLQFAQVRFFSCSALGRMPNAADGTPFVPERVLEPLDYILGHVGVLPANRLAASAAVA